MYIIQFKFTQDIRQTLITVPDNYVLSSFIGNSSKISPTKS